MGWPDAVRAVQAAWKDAPGESVAALRSSGAGRLRQPVEFGGSGLSAHDCVCAVAELAAIDCSVGWLAAMVNAAAGYLADSPDGAARLVWESHPDALITLSHSGSGDHADGRVTGRWHAVGAGCAQWLLLSTQDHRVLISSDGVAIHPVVGRGLDAARVCEVVADDADVAYVVADDGRRGHVAAAAAAAVVGTADGLWRTHVEQARNRLAVSRGGGEVTDDSAAELARAASDIDAATIHVTSESAAGTSAHAVAMVCRAVDRVLGSSRHALDASDTVTGLWRDVHAGARLAAALH